MGFEDLDEAASEQSTEAEAAADTNSESVSRMTTESDTAAADREETDLRDEPAFPFVQDELQANVYAREQVRDDWEETRKFEVDRILHDYGVENVAGREHHDAIFRLAADHPELWVRYVMEARGLDVPDDLGEE
jgi:hypothetical protein